MSMIDDILKSGVVTPIVSERSRHYQPPPKPMTPKELDAFTRAELNKLIDRLQELAISDGRLLTVDDVQDVIGGEGWFP